MISYLDILEKQSEEGRQEVIKNLSELLLAIADVSARIATSSVITRRSLYLRTWPLKTKQTEVEDRREKLFPYFDMEIRERFQTR